MNNYKSYLLRLFVSVHLTVFLVSFSYANDPEQTLQKREKLSITCAGIYEYQYLTGGFDATLLLFKREMMGQIVYNNINSPHLGDKEYFDRQVKQAYGDLLTLTDEKKDEYRYEQWKLKPAFCDELAASMFILITAREWSEGGDKTYSLADATLRDIYPWQNETYDFMHKVLNDHYQSAMKNRKP